MNHHDDGHDRLEDELRDLLSKHDPVPPLVTQAAKRPSAGGGSTPSWPSSWQIRRSTPNHPPLPAAPRRRCGR